MEENNKKSVVAILGSAGTGKSALCHTLCGDMTRKRFPENPTTHTWKFEANKQQVHWFGNDTEFVLIDTPGLGNSAAQDLKSVVDIVKTFKETGYVNAFLIVFNGQDPRIDERLKTMLTIFKEMLGESFIQNVLLVFTRWPMDQRSRAIRAKIGETEEYKGQAYNEKIQELCSFDTTANPIPCFFLDNCCLERDLEVMTEEELECFYTEVKKLRTSIETLPAYDCREIKVVRRGLGEDQKKLEGYTIKDLHETLKGKTREEYTISFVSELRKRFPLRNCLIIDNKSQHTIKLHNYVHEHVEKPATFGTDGYDVYVFEEGFVRKSGDGGTVNWAFEGSFTAMDSVTITFHIITPM